ncbi:hypothetical protein [Aquimarina agarivorans]|uniref:hypothetical protein n=1 Tax=Aquimarina agarivorans TaxID=980584 RepID=UPI000248E853|nr:hypothetical protein [Aquimarina agarivorans]
MSKKKFIYIIVGFLSAFFLGDYVVGAILSGGLDKYYGLNSNAELAIVGHSHLMLGIDKQKIEQELNIGVAKYTREGVNLDERKIMIDQLLEANKNIKTIIIGVDAWSFTDEGLSANSYKLFFPFMEYHSINDYLKEESDWQEYVTKKMVRTSRYNELLLGGALRGYLGNWSNLKNGKVDVPNLKEQIKSGVYRKITINNSKVNTINKILNTLEKNKIKVILLNVPTIDIMIDAQKEKATEVFGELNKVAKKYKNTTFLNLQEPWSHKYDLFYDGIHLNPEGQKVITAEIVTYLNRMDLLH